MSDKDNGFEAEIRDADRLLKATVKASLSPTPDREKVDRLVDKALRRIREEVESSYARGVLWPEQDRYRENECDCRCRSRSPLDRFDPREQLAS